MTATGGGGMPRDKFTDELAALINRHSLENASNTPDFILAEYLRGCLDAFGAYVRARDRWYGIEPRPGAQSTEDSADG